MLGPPMSHQGHNEQTSHEQIQTNGVANIELNSSETVIEDPHTTTKRCRPALPKRMKTQIEQVREKMIQQESKKKKKATSNLNSGEKTNIIQQNFQKSTINLKNMKTTARITFPFPRKLTNQAKVQEGQENNIKEQRYIAKQLGGIKHGVGDHKEKRKKKELSNIMRL